jgi:hypothetical protein
MARGRARLTVCLDKCVRVNQCHHCPVVYAGDTKKVELLIRMHYKKAHGYDGAVGDHKGTYNVNTLDAMSVIGPMMNGIGPLRIA